MMNILKNDKLGRVTTDLLSDDFTSNRRIWITGTIDSETAKNTIIELEYLDSISHDDITVYINSPGGVVSDGLAILDAMKRCRSEIVTVATGMAASMGAFLFSCGGTKGKRYITANTELMIHQPLGGIQGQATEIELAARHILRIKQKLNTLVAEASGRSTDEIAYATERDNYMTAEEAIRFGLADKIY